MSDKRHIVHTCNNKTVAREYRKDVEMKHKMKEVQTKLMRGLLDLVVVQFLRVHPMHGYKIITSIRKNFGVYFGPSTIYPLLGALEENGCIKSQWDLESDRPRKVYSLTPDGSNLLNGTEESLNHICRRLTSIGLNRIPLNRPSSSITQPQKLV